MVQNNPTHSSGKSLIIRSEEPYNAETTLEQLVESHITPTDQFFVRSHGSIPQVDPDRYQFTVTGQVDTNLVLSLTDLREYFPRRSITATLQCAGNRRDELTSYREIPGEIPWSAGAVSTAAWTGTPLKEVLSRAGFDPAARNLAFSGLDEIYQEGRAIHFGGSIPMEKALEGETLLAYEMNGEPLRPEHGYPLRLVIPGYIGARSVKWLGQLSVQADPSDNYYFRHAYRLYLPGDSAHNETRAASLGENFLNAVICSPAPGVLVSPPGGLILMRGYALTGRREGVARVEISLDGEKTWLQAVLEPPAVGVWQLWECEARLQPGRYQAVARAFHEDGSTQPETLKQVWNHKGYMNNSWHRVEFEVI